MTNDKPAGQIQQAIFTSCRTSRMDGYQLVAASQGVTKEQADELSAWGPAHDSLLRGDLRGSSINFHLLQGGVACVSKTLAAGAEYSGRSGPRVYTICLLVAPELLSRFANQPFRILDAVAASGHLRVASRLPESLPPISLRGRASATMPSLLTPLADEASRRQALALLAAATMAEIVLIRAGENFRALVDWTMNLLPVECRPMCTFSTGLKYSTQRRFRIALAPDDALECSRVARQTGATLIDLHEHPAGKRHPCAWVVAVDELLRSGQTSELIAVLNQPRPNLTLSQLGKASPEEFRLHSFVQN
jgi:hypothetical protein